MRSTVVVAALTVLLAGCSPSDGQSAPGPRQTPTSDRAGAPTITAPRELSSRAANPCRTLLDPVQVRRLGYRLPGEASVDVLGSPTCTWREEEKGRTAIVSVVLTRDLFVDTYRNRFLPIFRPLQIAGLPAVDIKSDPQDLACTTTVGVADGQSLDLNTTVGGGLDGIPDVDPCEDGHRVAEEILSTLPPR